MSVKILRKEIKQWKFETDMPVPSQSARIENIIMIDIIPVDSQQKQNDTEQTASNESDLKNFPI